MNHYHLWCTEEYLILGIESLFSTEEYPVVKEFVFFIIPPSNRHLNLRYFLFFNLIVSLIYYIGFFRLLIPNMYFFDHLII